jgi:hypothetical protein
MWLGLSLAARAVLKPKSGAPVTGVISRTIKTRREREAMVFAWASAFAEKCGGFV